MEELLTACFQWNLPSLCSKYHTSVSVRTPFIVSHSSEVPTVAMYLLLTFKGRIGTWWDSSHCIEFEAAVEAAFPCHTFVKLKLTFPVVGNHRIDNRLRNSKFGHDSPRPLNRGGDGCACPT